MTARFQHGRCNPAAAMVSKSSRSETGGYPTSPWTVSVHCLTFLLMLQCSQLVWCARWLIILPARSPHQRALCPARSLPEQALPERWHRWRQVCPCRPARKHHPCCFNPNLPPCSLERAYNCLRLHAVQLPAICFQITSKVSGDWRHLACACIAAGGRNTPMPSS